MIHQSQLFVCPGQSHGISWNICLGRQECAWEKCDSCPYQGWHQKGFPGFNPYAGAFTKTLDYRKRLAFYDKKPKKSNRVYQAPVQSFLPSDIGLEQEPQQDFFLVRLFKKVYELI